MSARVYLDRDLQDQIKGLHLEFKDVAQPELLIPLPYQAPTGVGEPRDLISASTEEFTSLCPLNISQPDYARLTIRYLPSDKIVELKSLKLYLVSYRQVPIFHELVTRSICDDLVRILRPEWLEVLGYFSVRGGVDLTVKSTYGNVPGRE